MKSENLLDALDRLLACLDGLSDSATQANDRLRAKVGLSGPSHAEPVDLSECEHDILLVIGELDRRLTGDEVRHWLQRTNRPHGDSTVQRALAELTRRKGLLTNTEDTKGRGYGLRSWE